MNYIPSSTLSDLRKLYKSNSTLALLKAGRGVLQRGGFCKNTYASGENGLPECGDEDGVTSADSINFCAVGAILRGEYEMHKSLKSLDIYTPEMMFTVGNLDEILMEDEELMKKNGKGLSIAEYNDLKSTTKEDVLKIFDKAIKLSK